MVSRVPALSPLANSDSSFSIVIGKGPSPHIISLRPWLTLTLGLFAAALMGWYLVATLYLVFRDEMLSRLLSQQTEMQYAYEDRLAALRNQIDKVTSRQLLDQNSLEGKLHELISRQAQLETRHAIVANLAEQPTLSGIGTGITPSARQANKARPGMDLPESGRNGQPPYSTGSINSFAPIAGKPVPDDAFEIRNLSPKDTRATGGPEKRMNNSSLDRTSLPPATIAIHAARDLADQMERQQVATLEAMERSVRDKARRWSAVFSETGLEAERFVASGKKADLKGNSAFSAQGGPLVPLQGSPQANRSAGSFENRLIQLHNTIKQAEQMRRIVIQLPIDRPLPQEFETSSSFGARTDPFTRAMAMHTGMDFRAPAGTSVRSTAPGVVMEAGVTGGYGKMVEIDHGGGLTTRYAHLSALDVNIGDKVSKGSIVGRVGSTGRSTGAHLHYETRIDGDPTDPARFIRAGQRFGRP
jgi:murein DD-endopeptidase MepM/ murein hydrolase activator NlpD